MKKVNVKSSLAALGFLGTAIFTLWCFLQGIGGVACDHRQEDKRRLEEVLRRNAVACYASEGFYPPDVDYIIKHYGVQIDKNRYMISYVPIAQNLMPDITVLEK